MALRDLSKAVPDQRARQPGNYRQTAPLKGWANVAGGAGNVTYLAVPRDIPRQRHLIDQEVIHQPVGLLASSFALGGFDSLPQIFLVW